MPYNKLKAYNLYNCPNLFWLKKVHFVDYFFHLQCMLESKDNTIPMIWALY